MKLGVCYYPEHWPAERWPTDARLMREAGLSLVRIGEFAWAKMEPRSGQYAWEWLDQAIETLAGEGLQVVLGTPTATPPAWLCKAHPEILPVDNQGRRRHFGSRRHYCSSSPTYHRHTARIVTALAERYGTHPAVVAWQVDNEFGCHDTARCYCEQCALGFRRWLQEKYTGLDNLNEAWGNVFWSQTYSEWDEIEPPFLTVTEPNPSHVLDYYRFSSDNVAAYQQLQVDLLRKLAPGQPVTTNFMGNFPDLDYHKLARPLDFVTWDSYPTGFREVQAESLYHPDEPRDCFAFDAGDPYVTGFCHDLTRGLKQAPFWVMEQQAGHINWSLNNTGVHPGTVRLWTWHALASGAEAVVYFRWRAVPYAQEQSHSGLLKHDASPDTGYGDLLLMAPERSSMEEISAAQYDAQVALLLSYEDLWALQLQPHRRHFGALRHLFVYYRALQRLGIQVDIVSPEAALDGYRLVIAPTLFLADERLAATLNHYVRAGGTLLLGVRSAFKTPTNLVSTRPLPGALRDLAGITVQDWHALPDGVGYDFQTEITGLTGPASFWAEALAPRTSEAGSQVRILAQYTDGPFKERAALSQHNLGAGKAFYLGWYPGLFQAQALIVHFAQGAGITGEPGIPAGIIAVRRGTSLILLNFTGEPLTFQWSGKPVLVQPRNVRVVSDP